MEYNEEVDIKFEPQSDGETFDEEEESEYNELEQVWIIDEDDDAKMVFKEEVDIFEDVTDSDNYLIQSHQDIKPFSQFQKNEQLNYSAEESVTCTKLEKSRTSWYIDEGVNNASQPGQETKCFTMLNSKDEKPLEKQFFVWKNRLGSEDRIPCFTCKLCGKLFAYESLLNSHMKVHTQGHLLRCDTCSMSFGSRRLLKGHVRIHTNHCFICDTCGKSFVRKSGLRVHLRVHTKDQDPFYSSSCDSSFIHESEFADHKLIHIRRLPFECVICDESYASKADLIDHYKVHKKNRPQRCRISNN